MRYFVDTEYDWDADRGSLRPLSVGIVAEDDRELYLVHSGADRTPRTAFVRDVVYPAFQVMPRYTADDIRDRIIEFVGDDTPEFWGDYSAFDYVVISMLMGEFSDWPEGWPMHINDFQQIGMETVPSEIPHNALSDARAARDAWRAAVAK